MWITYICVKFLQNCSDEETKPFNNFWVNCSFNIFCENWVFCCCCFVLRIVWLFEQRWFKIEILCKIINVFTVTFDYFNASLLNKSINFFPKKNKKLNNPKYAIWVVSISWNLQHQCQSCSLSDPVEPRWLISFSYSTFIFFYHSLNLQLHETWSNCVLRASAAGRELQQFSLHPNLLSLSLSDGRCVNQWARGDPPALLPKPTVSSSRAHFPNEKLLPLSLKAPSHSSLHQIAASLLYKALNGL